MPFDNRHTKLVATLGPATESVEMLTKIIKAGVDTLRLNMAHGTHDWVRNIVKNAREAAKLAGRNVGIMMDIKGPEIRTGAIDEPAMLKAGDIVEFILNPEKVPAKGALSDSHYAVGINYPSFGKDVEIGQIILVDNGLIRMEVTEKNEEKVVAKVTIGAKMGSRRHINLPGAEIDLPAITQKDRDDLAVAAELKLEWIAQSFVRKASDIRECRAYLKEIESDAKIISKIEDQSAIRNLDEIVEETDALMVARGDLGVEIPFEELPIVQEKAIRSCKRLGKPVIVATHMLESMISAPFPTRAEITDIAHAVWQGADSVMLSGETTIGEFPIECVETVKRISSRVEATQEIGFNDEFIPASDKEKMILSAIVLAQDLGCSGIVLFTHSGDLARATSALRPQGCPIFAFTDDEAVEKRMNMLWGVEPFLTTFGRDSEEVTNDAIETLKKNKHAHAGEKLVLLTNIIAGHRVVNSIQLRIV